MFANVPGRGRIKSRVYKSWLTEAGWLVQQKRPKLITGRVRMLVLAGKLDNRKRDLDNLIKPCSDLLVTHGVIQDDMYVWQIIAQWEPGLDGVTLTVESLSDEVEVAA